MGWIAWRSSTCEVTGCEDLEFLALRLLDLCVACAQSRLNCEVSESPLLSSCPDSMKWMPLQDLVDFPGQEYNDDVSRTHLMTYCSRESRQPWQIVVLPWVTSGPFSTNMVIGNMVDMKDTSQQPVFSSLFLLLLHHSVWHIFSFLSFF